MRAGCFAETRVIRLVNRRFVSFYYSTGGPGLGKDPAAAAFVKGKVKNTFAFYAAFTAAGEPIGVTDVYADKDNTFDFLAALLRENPDLDHFTKEEEAVLAKAKASPDDPAARLAAGRLLEDLGRYKDAEPHFRAVLAGKADPAPAAEAYRGLLPMARYGRDWKTVRSLAKDIADLPPARARALDLKADVAMETAYALLAEKRYAAAGELLEAAIKTHPDSKRHSELRFSAGVAAYFQKDKDRAYYHWCWVVEELPGDRLARRCYTAAAHEGMPYENPELGGYAAPLDGGNIQVIQAAYEKARQRYETVKDGK
jgi:tetratricopeptide (TPR) repeat protein